LVAGSGEQPDNACRDEVVELAFVRFVPAGRRKIRPQLRCSSDARPQRVSRTTDNHLINAASMALSSHPGDALLAHPAPPIFHLLAALAQAVQTIAGRGGATLTSGF
jgi:hypothetical protein